MKLLSKEELEKLTTKRLLAYKSKLMSVPETPNWEEEESRLNKISKEWKTAYFELKTVLKAREHVEK